VLRRARALAMVVLLAIVALVGFSACGTGQEAQALRLSLEVPSQVRAGETVPLTMIARNVSHAPVELGLSGHPGAFCGDFVATTPGGVEVWRFIESDLPGSRACPANLYLETLGPGEELSVEGEWDQTDTRSVPVAAGSYLVRGILDITLGVNTPDERALTLQTQEQPLVIEPE
jgi:hypothetical protein